MSESVRVGKWDFLQNHGLTINHIKWIALIIMTIDHLGAYGFEIPIFQEHYNMLRSIGRIAAPLFFFALTESIRHTRSKLKLILRLYVGAVGTGLFVAITNLLFHDSVGRFSQSNILFDYVYVAIYVVLIEKIIEGWKNGQWKQIMLAICGIASTCIPHFIVLLIEEFPYGRYQMSAETVRTIFDFTGSFIESVIRTEYTVLFVAMGILMYIARSKYGKAVVLIVFSLICYFGSEVEYLCHYSVITRVLGNRQHYMILAVLFILLYNGEKGRGNKFFFYIYYPLHRYIISVIAYVYKIMISG